MFKYFTPKIFTWLVVLLIPVFAIYPALTTPLEERSYDAATFHIYRSVLFSAARAEGILYPRWVQPINAGLGGPLFSFYSPLTYFVLDGLNNLGLPPPLGWRVLVSVILLAAASGMFLLTQALELDAAAGIAATALYVYAFPFLRELFERGSPEGFALALCPWVAWGLIRVTQHFSGRRVLVAALVWAAAILTHNLAALLMLPFFAILLIGLAARRGWRVLGAPILVLGAGILLAAFFIVPFGFERNAVQLANAFQVDYGQVARNSLALNDLLALPASYDTGLDNNSIGDHLGWLSGLVIIASGLASVGMWRRHARWWAGLTALVVGFGLIGIWLQTPWSNGVWQTLTILALVQIRTRLLGLVSLAIALGGGLMLYALRARWREPVAYGVAALAILVALPVLYPQFQYRYTTFAAKPTPQQAAEFAMQASVPGLTAFNEFLPVWRTVPFTDAEAQAVAANMIANLPQGTRVLQQNRRNDQIQVELDVPVPFAPEWSALYFPGWQAEVDGVPRALAPMPETGYSVMDLVPVGNHTLTLRYVGTTAQWVGTGISLATLCALVLFAFVGSKRRAANPLARDLTPHGWLIVGLVFLVGVKSIWLDPRTLLFRQASQCDAIQDAVTPTQVRFGDNLVLCGIHVAARALKPGDAVRVTAYWLATAPVREPAESFVHLFGAAFNPTTNTPLWGQQDKHAPGEHLVTQWVPGKLYRDVYEFPIDAATPPGDYTLEMGWWQPDRGQRLKPVMLSPTNGVTISTLDSIFALTVTVQ